MGLSKKNNNKKYSRNKKVKKKGDRIFERPW